MHIFCLLFIISGEDIPESCQGIYASDPDAFCVFRELFDPIIRDTHGLTGSDVEQPDLEFGDPKHSDLDLKEYDVKSLIISTRVRVARNIDGFPFSTFIDNDVNI